MAFGSNELAYWILQTIAMMVTAALIPGLRITSPLGAILMVVGIAFVNSKAWDAALFFQIPNQLSYQAGLLFLSNGVIFWLLVKLLPGIEVRGFIPALLAPVIFTVCSLVIAEYAPRVDWVKIYNSVLDFTSSVKKEVAPTSDGSKRPKPTH